MRTYFYAHVRPWDTGATPLAGEQLLKAPAAQQRGATVIVLEEEPAVLLHDVMSQKLDEVGGVREHPELPRKGTGLEGINGGIQEQGRVVWRCMG